jgi:hypothetical protein
LDIIELVLDEFESEYEVSVCKKFIIVHAILGHLHLQHIMKSKTKSFCDVKGTNNE